ncbi:hypothetical protein LEMLEM_LOCUS27244 [Lemmus lemmus]
MQSAVGYLLIKTEEATGQNLSSPSGDVQDNMGLEEYIPEGTAGVLSLLQVSVLWSLGEQLRKLCFRPQARAEMRAGCNRFQSLMPPDLVYRVLFSE